MPEIVWFSDDDATTQQLVGGKGVNLGRLTKAGFTVPAGFTVTTEAYTRFLELSGLDRKIAAILDHITYDDSQHLESCTAEIRELIETAAVPAEQGAVITAAYEQLGSGAFVAVRSSGTAEDLAGASFAGLHDTYLDVLGADGVIDAVRRCWASLWTARATSYRNNKGFDHFEAPIAVVVQTMVESEVSGVMFTGNPMTTATDEIVINASWGLGEAVVQGITTPDEYIVRHGTLKVVEQTLGGKTVRIVRDPVTGVGTVTEDVPEADRVQWTMSADQVTELADLGRRVQAAYNEFPQDIEWALSGGAFYLLQARPITGVDFSWDAEINASVPGKEEDHQIWSRTWTDEVWTGAVTPLMYSWRALCMNMGHTHAVTTLGFDELDYTRMRLWNYYKGEVYYNPQLDKAMIEKTVPPPLRPLNVSKLPAGWQQETVEAPFNWSRYLRMFARIQALTPTEGYRWFDHLKTDFIGPRSTEFDGLPDAELRRLSDDELKKYIHHMVEIEGKGYDIVWTGLITIFRDVLGTLAVMLTKWYDGDNPNILTDIVSGTREQTTTSAENLELWRLSERIRNSEQLMAAFREHESPEFFTVIEQYEEGRAFLAHYRDFVAQNGHRGHSDRDIYFTRRAEDPMVDYRAFKALLSTDRSIDPTVREREVNERRERAVDQAVENIRRKPMGGMKAEAFKFLVSYMHKCIAGRDNERHFFDRSTFAIKKGFIEVSRRCLERGYLDGERDFYFLTMPELFDVLDGRANLPLCEAKIAARMVNFDNVDTKEVVPPLYLQRGKPVNLDQAGLDAGDGVLRGAGTSRGTVTGTARVIKTLKEIGRVQAGEILIVNSTDPGWTPVFLVINGIVLETGGMLAHGALLAREYGFPAVQIANAMQLIPDGATITIDGDAGTVTIQEGDPDSNGAGTPASDLVDATA